jgi:nicotinate-nucleotide adenylyltransferase
MADVVNMTSDISPSRRRVAFFGGSFDPVHNGHVSVARALLDQFKLDEFVFIPAFQAPHKKRNKPTSAYDRFAMLCLVTQDEPMMRVSKMEIDMPERPFSVETLERLNAEFPQDEIFFVIGADSWMEITAWREWEKVLTMANTIVVTRPGTEIGFSHITDAIRERLIDLRTHGQEHTATNGLRIYVTDAMSADVSATEIRRKLRSEDASRLADVPAEVAKYIEKYQIYS